MFAIIRSGGKQFIVHKDDIINLPRMEAKKKAKIDLEVLALSDKDKVSLGNPILKNIKVEGEVIEERKGKKIEVLKYRAKKRYRKHSGFRPIYTRVKITKISGSV